MTKIDGGAEGHDEDTMAQAQYPVVFAAVTLLSAIAAYMAVSPQSCLAVRRCAEIDEALPTLLNGYATCGLVTVFLHEATSLCLNYRSARPLVGLINGIENVFVPPVLLCTSFAVLVLENAIFWSNSAAAFSHSAAPGAGVEANEPVYTIIYIEWLINVPILIILAGKCALGRPLRDLTGALLCTNVYIIIAWSAHFVANPWLRWALISSSFAMYGWASYEMVQWVMYYWQTADIGAPSRMLRPCLTLGLVLIFGVYGVVYLCTGLGMLTGYEERVIYIVMNIGVKLIMSMAFAGIRSTEYHDMLVDMLVNAKIPFQRQVACSYVEAGDGFVAATRVQVERQVADSSHQAVEQGRGDHLTRPLLSVS